MKWMNDIATCSHAGSEYDFHCKGKRFRICARCARLMGWDDIGKNWKFLGSFDNFLAELRMLSLNRVEKKSKILENAL